MKTFMKKWKWKILILVYLCFIYGNSLILMGDWSSDVCSSDLAIL